MARRLSIILCRKNDRVVGLQNDPEKDESEPHKPTIAARAPDANCAAILQIVTGQLLGYEPFPYARDQISPTSTEHPNALPAAWRLSLVNRRSARRLFHRRCTRTELK